MSITVEWLNPEKSIIIYRLEGRWTWQDLYGAIETAVQLMDEVQHTVNIILDMTKSPTLPNLNPVGLQKVAYAPTAKHPNMGYFFMVGAKPYVKTMFDIFGRMYPRAIEQYKLANTLEEAIQQIASSGA